MIAYGIATEQSDVRVHVSVCTNLAFVFETEAMRKFIAEDQTGFREVPAYQPGVKGPTARGLLVPVWLAEFVETVSYEGHVDVKPSSTWSTSQKGEWAASVVSTLAKAGRLPLHIKNASEQWSRKVQISGTDVIVSEAFRIQTKCDSMSCPEGNLFIQTHEINPLGMH